VNSNLTDVRFADATHAVAVGYSGKIYIILSRWLLANQMNPDLLPWALALAGVMSVIGHNWSVFMGWRGGAGTGPNVGWGTALWWPMLPIAIVVMSGMLLGIGMASVASLTMGALIAIVFFVLYVAGIPPFDASLAYIVGGLVAFAIVSWALRPNIKRLLNGTERVVGPRAWRLKRRQETKNGN
jgi:glycerol-3-phosphate acyltransferase PlsY